MHTQRVIKLSHFYCCVEWLEERFHSCCHTKHTSTQRWACSERTRHIHSWLRSWLTPFVPLGVTEVFVFVQTWDNISVIQPFWVVFWWLAIYQMFLLCVAFNIWKSSGQSRAISILRIWNICRTDQMSLFLHLMCINETLRHALFCFIMMAPLIQKLHTPTADECWMVRLGRKNVDKVICTNRFKAIFKLKPWYHFSRPRGHHSGQSIQITPKFPY